ncbi:MAG TPA: type VI secretion system contractile sheath large subunit, partial [Desulfobacterales bacterium]|nr:type VI secretion system contractile sheath large subunit [Desulfobacterales bacterium]
MAEEEKEQQVQEQPSESPDGAGLLDKIIEQGRMARDKSQEPYARDMLGEFVTQVLDEGMTVQKDTVAAINQRIADIDELLTAQVNEIMHAEEFQKLEGSWKGLEFLVKNTETSPSLKLRLLNISKKDVHKDLERAVEFDQSQLFKKIYEAEYGVFGGMPYSLLIGDYEFGRHPQDIDLLEKMSNVAAAAHAPFIAAASPDLFDMDSFNQLSDPRDLSKIFESKEAGMIKWRSFRDSEDSRYVALVMPHILMRLPYGAKTKPVEGFNFEEDVSGKVHGKYLWGNAAYALGQRIADAF